jgi:hypothetical protein
LTWLCVAVIPPLSVVGLVVWARRLSKTGGPRVAVWVAYTLTATIGLVTVPGYVEFISIAIHPIGGVRVEPSQIARALAEGFSDAMNWALALLMALVGGACFGFWRWRVGFWRSRWRGGRVR